MFLEVDETDNQFLEEVWTRAGDMPVAARRLLFSLRLRLGDRIMLQRFRNYQSLLLYLRYQRPILSPLRRMEFNNRSSFFGGSGEQNRNPSGDPKNCSKHWPSLAAASRIRSSSYCSNSTSVISSWRRNATDGVNSGIGKLRIEAEDFSSIYWWVRELKDR